MSMSTDVVSTVMLSIASRTQQGVQIAVMRRAHQMETNMLQMIDDTMASARQASAPSPSSRALDRRV